MINFLYPLILFNNTNFHQFNFNFENDVLYNTDKYYNHSSKLDLIFKNKNKIYNISYSNEMYTPEFHKLNYQVKNDMLYTSFNELSFGKTNNVFNNKINLFNEIGIGYTGKYTYASNIMNFVHNHIPSNPIFLRWNTQLKFRLILRYTTIIKYKQKLIKNKVDYIQNTGFSFSNLRSFINIGGQLRIGKLNNNFGTYTNYSNNLNYFNSNNLKFNLFVGYNLKHTFNDITLRNLDMIKNQYEYNYGVSIKYKKIGFSFVSNVESKRFKKQNTNNFGFSNFVFSYIF